MGLMDKVKASAEVGLAKATEAGKAGQAKLDAAQAKHRADGLLRELGAVVYAERTGRGHRAAPGRKPSGSSVSSRPTKRTTARSGRDRGGPIGS